MPDDPLGGICCATYALAAAAGLIAAVYFYLNSRKKEKDLEDRMRRGVPDNV
jgi:hypothetical protein